MQTSSSLPLYRVRVAVPIPLYQTFDYCLTEQDFQLAQIGARVLVPFGQQKLVAIILEKLSPDVPMGEFRLKSIIQLLDTQAILDTQSLQLLLWSAKYYQYPVGEVLHVGLPALLRQGKSAQILSHKWRITTQDVGNQLKSSLKQQQAYQILQLHPNGTTEDILNASGVLTVTLNALLKKGLVECIEDEFPQASSAEIKLAQLPLTPNADQQYAIQQILAKLGHYHGFLLDGLTGSGKTEVYLQVMYEVLQQGKQVLVLVPEIGLTPQTIARFQSRFHTSIAILHSALNDSKRLHAWLQAQAGQARIVLGTRSAIFTPMPNLGLIVLDEEHDLSYKQQEGFRYHARDVALYRAYMQQCPIILGSATPSIESYHLVEQQKLTALQLNQRAGIATLPQLHTIDLTVAKKNHGLSQQLIDKITQHLKHGEQVLIFINRRGYAPVLFCESCAWQADCPRCDAHFTVHRVPYEHLHCHHCGLIYAVPQHCPNCQKANTLKPLGMGTVKVEQILTELFPHYPILRIDRDSTSKVGSWEKLYEQLQENKPLILLGTQMLSKGHHFPYVTLVAILDIDSGFFSVDFRAPERTAQQIIQVAGRAGRIHKKGEVYLQTYRPDHPMLKILLEQDYRQFVIHSLQERKVAKLPPYSYSALIRVSSKDDAYNMQFLNQALELLVKQQNQSPSTPIQIWGPIPAPMARKAGYHLAHVLLLAEHRAYLHQQVAKWWQIVVKLPKLHQLKLSLDIDPIELN